jgi:hypothetical protein
MYCLEHEVGLSGLPRASCVPGTFGTILILHRLWSCVLPRDQPVGLSCLKSWRDLGARARVLGLRAHFRVRTLPARVHFNLRLLGDYIEHQRGCWIAVPLSFSLWTYL